MKNIHTLCLTGLAATALSAAADIDLSKLPPASTKTGVTFAADIKPLFDESCVRCHGAQRPKSGLRLDTLEGVLKGSKDGPVLEVGKSAQSDLVISISMLDPETAMPPKRGGKRGGDHRPPQPADHGTNAPGDHPPGQRPNGPGNQTPAKPLTAEQVGLVRAWIDQGAK